ncbi:hypothetical protein VC83_04934 [Pseudogymnoascus destructans]|uniref:Uncharacterized protein n=1 Tax=Pseudogymnoascus destructans TaxID=655981 RepID=A0A177A965_9PEZI|nr:uncharacterized protein VC83_04934 [Pseudogymnoascus destructans]OAF58669.1 hypothetical protein VC83_04934 [Pseudogymnoascus destructans]
MSMFLFVFASNNLTGISHGAITVYGLENGAITEAKATSVDFDRDDGEVEHMAASGTKMITAKEHGHREAKEKRHQEQSYILYNFNNIAIIHANPSPNCLNVIIYSAQPNGDMTSSP